MSAIHSVPVWRSKPENSDPTSLLLPASPSPEEILTNTALHTMEHKHRQLERCSWSNRRKCDARPVAIRNTLAKFLTSRPQFKTSAVTLFKTSNNPPNS